MTANKIATKIDNRNSEPANEQGFTINYLIHTSDRNTEKKLQQLLKDKMKDEIIIPEYVHNSREVHSELVLSKHDFVKGGMRTIPIFKFEEDIEKDASNRMVALWDALREENNVIYPSTHECCARKYQRDNPTMKTDYKYLDD